MSPTRCLACVCDCESISFFHCLYLRPLVSESTHVYTQFEAFLHVRRSCMHARLLLSFIWSTTSTFTCQEDANLGVATLESKLLRTCILVTCQSRLLICFRTSTAHDQQMRP
jgi:hypothetical protein